MLSLFAATWLMMGHASLGKDLSPEGIPHDTVQLAETSVEASAVSSRLHVNTPTPQQTFDYGEMARLGMTGVSDALRLMQGVRVTDYGGLGGMKTVSIRNLGATHTGVMWDGIPVSNCQAGQIDLQRFSADMLSQVKLGIGAPGEMLTPASVEPYSGLIAMQSQANSRTSVSYGSWNTLQVQTQQRIGSHMDGRLHYSHTDGNYPYILQNGTHSTRQRRNNGQIDNLDGEVNLRTPHSELKAYYWQQEAHLPGSIILYNNVSREQSTDRNFLTQGRWHGTLKEGNLRWQLLTKYNYARSTYFDGTPNTLPNDPAQHHFCYRQHEAFLSAGATYEGLTRRKGHPLSYRLALIDDVTANTFSSNMPSNPRPVRWSNYTSLRGQLHSHRFQLNGTLLLTMVTDPTASSFRHFDPSLACNVLLSRHFGMRLSARSAYRLPSFNDLYYHRIGNRSLRPETSREYNAGFTFRHGSPTWTLSATVDAYRNVVSNKIVAIPGTFAWRMYNYGNCQLDGFESSVLANLRSHGYSMTASASYTLSANDDLPYVARHSATASLSLQLPCRTSVGYTLQANGTRYSQATHNWRYRLPSFALHDVTISQPLGHLTLSLTVRNLTDTHYELVQFYPMPGRSFLLAVRYTH